MKWKEILKFLFPEYQIIRSIKKHGFFVNPDKIDQKLFLQLAEHILDQLHLFQHDHRGKCVDWFEHLVFRRQHQVIRQRLAVRKRLLDIGQRRLAFRQRSLDEHQPDEHESFRVEYGVRAGDDLRECRAEVRTG